MTEYDYSPEAYERFMATQQRIANWVDQTENHRPQFESATDPAPRDAPRSVHPPEHAMPSRRSRHRPPPIHLHQQFPPHCDRPPSPSESCSSEEYVYASGPGSPGPMPYPSPVFSLHNSFQPFASQSPPHTRPLPQGRAHSPRSHRSHPPASHAMEYPLMSPPYGYSGPGIAVPPMGAPNPGYIVLPPGGSRRNASHMYIPRYY